MFKIHAGLDEARRHAVSAFLPVSDVVAVENADGAGRHVVVCEHASNEIPARLQALGLSVADLGRHIAWDPGALGVARALATHLDAALVFCKISRLVIDCNRDPAMSDAVPAASEDTPIPGNQEIPTGDRAWRINAIYHPFHTALAGLLAKKRSGGPVSLIGMHSFTPIYRGVTRPWHIGVLHDRDESLSAPLLAGLRQDSTLVVGENQPYSPDDRVYHTLDRHAQAQGQPSVMIEIRNDLLETRDQQRAWGKRIGKIVEGM
jgi:predicted N-formylglutamate amidohydrolase